MSDERSWRERLSRATPLSERDTDRPTDEDARGEETPDDTWALVRPDGRRLPVSVTSTPRNDVLVVKQEQDAPLETAFEGVTTANDRLDGLFADVEPFDVDIESTLVADLADERDRLIHERMATAMGTVSTVATAIEADRGVAAGKIEWLEERLSHLKD